MLYRIDDKGLFVEDVILDEVPTTTDENGDETLDTHYIATPVPDGFYLPKWDGAKWIEGKTADEIKAITDKPQEPSIESRLTAIEDTLLNIL